MWQQCGTGFRGVAFQATVPRGAVTTVYVLETIVTASTKIKIPVTNATLRCVDKAVDKL